METIVPPVTKSESGGTMLRGRAASWGSLCVCPLKPLKYVSIHHSLMENLSVHFFSFKSGMSNLLSLLGITDTPTQVNILKQVKNVHSSFGLCGLLKNHFCSNRKFYHFTHHLFIQWGIPKKRKFSDHMMASAGKCCSRRGDQWGEREEREGRQKGRRGWGSRSEGGRGHLALTSSRPSRPRYTDTLLRKLLLLSPFKVLISLLQWKILLGSFFKLESLFSQEITKIFPLRNYLRM